MRTAGAGSARLRLVLAMGIYGTIGLFVRWIPLPSGIIANARSIIGTLFLLMLIILRRERIHWQAIRRNLRYLLPCGVMLGFNWILLFEAYRYTTVAIATVCYYLAPIFILLASPLLGEKLTALRCACGAAALLGMVLTSGAVSAGPGGSVTGVLFGVLAAAAYAAIVLLNKRPQDISPYDVTLTQLGISALVLLPYNLLTADLSVLSCTPSAGALLLVLGVVHTGVAYTLYFGAIPHMPAQTAAIFSYIDPVLAILLSALLLREPMNAATAAGAVLVLGATLVSELAQGRKKPAPSA